LHNHIKTTIILFPPVAEPVEADGNPVISSAFWIPGQARNDRKPFKNVISMSASYEKSYASALSFPKNHSVCPPLF